MRNRQSRVSPFSLTFLLQSFDNPVNVGHMFRLADAVGAEKLVLTGRTQVPPHHEISITSMGQENRIPYEYCDKVEDALKTLKDEGYHLISLEVTEDSVLYTEPDYSKHDKICLILGNETDGVYPSSLKFSDEIVYIPMFGKNYSLNVHVAAAIVAYKIVSG